YSQLGTTAYDDKLGVELSNQKLEIIKAAKNYGNKTETDYAISLSDDGKARIKISTHFYGENYNWDNRFFSELPPEERKHYFQEVVSGVAQGARAIGDLTTKFDTYPGLEQFTVDVDNYSVAAGKYFYFDLPFTPSLFGAETDQRSLPLFISDGNENIFHTEIKLPPGFRQMDIAPKSENFIAPGGSQARITRMNADGKCVITDQFEVVPGIISPKNYPAMLNIQSALGEKSATVFLLERQ
ncbi:MAG: hypothetical protein ACREFE_09720, partial [Limisphaerales bacterium]